MAGGAAVVSLCCMGERLTALDATFLELEEADETAHMHIGAVTVFEGGPPSLARLRTRIEERLPALPPYRRRLSEPRTGGLRWPSWVDHQRFDIADHVRECALPAPAGRDALCEWAAEFWSTRLDRRLPLWEAVLLRDVGEGRWAIATKTHHCLVDGVGSIDAAYLTLDLPDGASVPEAPLRAEPAPHHAILSSVSHLVAGATRSGLDLAVHPGHLRDLLARAGAVAGLVVRDELIPAPRTSLNEPIGSRRRFAAITVDLAEMKAIKNGLGGTLNDAVLTAVAGALRALLLARHETLPARGLRAMVPVNVRPAGERLGNHVSSLFVELPVAEDDPAERHALTRRRAEALKADHQADAGRDLVTVAGHAPPVVHSVLAQSLFASRLFNVTVTNVPGPQVPLTCFGGRVAEVLPLVPLAAEHAVGVCICSYDGRLTFGLVADHESVGDFDVLCAGLVDSLDELRELAGLPVAAAPPGRPRRARPPRSRSAASPASAN